MKKSDGGVPFEDGIVSAGKCIRRKQPLKMRTSTNRWRGAPIWGQGERARVLAATRLPTAR